MAVFTRRWKPYSNPMGIGAEQLGAVQDDVYDEFLRRAEESYSGVGVNPDDPLNPDSMIQAEQMKYRGARNQAAEMGMRSLDSIRRVIQARAEMKARGNYSTGAAEMNPDVLRTSGVVNAPPRIDDYRAMPGETTLGMFSKTQGRGSPYKSNSLGGTRAGGVGQPFGNQSFKNPSSGFFSVGGNPKSRGLYDRRG
jgi:hypothetical protein